MSGSAPLGLLAAAAWVSLATLTDNVRWALRECLAGRPVSPERQSALQQACDEMFPSERWQGTGFALFKLMQRAVGEVPDQSSYLKQVLETLRGVLDGKPSDQTRIEEAAKLFGRANTLALDGFRRTQDLSDLGPEGEDKSDV